MTALVRIGYWANDRNSDMPRPEDLIDEGWDEREREATAAYFAAGTIVRAYLGHSECRLCGQQNGSREFSDGKYIWPEGLAHYVDAHQVRLPNEVVAHAAARVKALEEAGVDDAWWRTVGHA